MSTIIKVAERAGVAVSTVSYVLSGKRPIGDETKQRVLDAIEELGYVPNASAQGLRSTKTRVLALAGFSGLTDVPVGGLFLAAIAEAARKRSYDVLLVPSHDSVSELTRLSRSSMVDAVLLMSILVRDPRVDALRRLRVPAALLGHPEDDPGLSWIDLDFDAAGQLSVEQLVARGRRSLAFVGPPVEVLAAGAGYAVRTWRGAQAAADDAGVTLQAQVGITTHAVREQLERIFAAAPDTDGLILHFDYAAHQVLSALRMMGRRVPEDVAVVVVGGWQQQETESPVTFVGSTVDKITDGGVDLAIAASNGEPTRTILLPPEVTVSDSC